MKHPHKAAQILTTLILVLAVIASIPFILYVARPDNIMLDVFTFLFMGMLVFPYLLLLGANFFLNYKPQHSFALCLISLLIVLLAIAAFYYGFFYNATGTNGLLLVAIPMSQIAIAVITVAILFIAKRKMLRHS